MRNTFQFGLISVSIALSFLSGCAGGCKQEPLETKAADTASADVQASPSAIPVPQKPAVNPAGDNVKSADEHRNEAKARITVDNVNSELNAIEREINALEKRLEKGTSDRR